QARPATAGHPASRERFVPHRPWRSNIRLLMKTFVFMIAGIDVPCIAFRRGPARRFTRGAANPGGGSMTKSVIRLAAVLASALLAALAGTGPARADVTLDVFYAQPSFARYHDPIAQAFMKAHPDIRIVFRAPAADYDVGHQAMLREAVTNNLPDIYFPGFHLLPELTDVLVPRKQILDLGPLLAAEPAEWRTGNYADKILDLGKVH